MTDAASRAFSRALIVDDHPLFCDALALTLRSIAGVAEVDCASSLGMALERIARGPRPDVVLLDLDLPDVDGLDGLLRLRAAEPGLPVLVVSSMTEPRLIGAALEALGRGERWVPDGVAAIADATSDAVARLSQLTRQQAKILELLCQGRLNKQIAWELSIAETTVKAHVTAIMRKLGVQSRTQAVLLAQEARFASFVPEG